jgi:hypothetical protein
MLDGKLQSGQLEGHKVLKFIPLVLRWAAGVPSIVQNPSNEEITLTDVGTGDVLLTFAEAGLSPLIVVGSMALSTVPGGPSNIATLKVAPTTSALALYIQSVADGATEADPVDLHLVVCKMIAA